MIRCHLETVGLFSIIWLVICPFIQKIPLKNFKSLLQGVFTVRLFFYIVPHKNTTIPIVILWYSPFSYLESCTTMLESDPQEHFCCMYIHIYITWAAKQSSGFVTSSPTPTPTYPGKSNFLESAAKLCSKIADLNLLFPSSTRQEEGRERGEGDQEEAD